MKPSDSFRHSGPLDPQERMVTVGGRVEALEINPTVVARFKTEYQRGAEEEIPDTEIDENMQQALRLFDDLQSNYGIESVYMAHKIEQAESTERDDGKGLLIVAHRVHGEPIYEAALSTEHYQLILDLAMRYAQDKLSANEPMFLDLRPENLFWGHTADDTADRLINIDPDPDVGEGDLSAMAVRTNLDCYWEPFAAHYGLDDSSIRQTWRATDQAFSRNGSH